MVVKTSAVIGSVFVSLGFLAALSTAQAEPTAAATANGQATVPAANDGAKQAPSSVQTGRSESLSNKLSRSDGVIAPKGNIDPGMKTPAPVPHPNSTPVIPPSATGGNSAK